MLRTSLTGIACHFLFFVSKLRINCNKDPSLLKEDLPSCLFKKLRYVVYFVCIKMLMTDICLIQMWTLLKFGGITHRALIYCSNFFPFVFQIHPFRIPISRTKEENFFNLHELCKDLSLRTRQTWIFEFWEHYRIFQNILKKFNFVVSFTSQLSAVSCNKNKSVESIAKSSPLLHYHSGAFPPSTCLPIHGP